MNAHLKKQKHKKNSAVLIIGDAAYDCKSKVC